MNRIKISNEKILFVKEHMIRVYHGILDTYDKIYFIDIKTILLDLRDTILMFMETTGLHSNKSKLTLLSLVYNEKWSRAHFAGI